MDIYQNFEEQFGGAFGNDVPTDDTQDDGAGGGFFQNLFQGAGQGAGQGAQGWINNFLGGVKPPAVETEVSMSKETQTMMYAGIALLAILVLKRLKVI